VLFRQAEPILLLRGDDAIDIGRDRDALPMLRTWSEVAPLFDAPQKIATRLAGLRFIVPQYEQGNESDIRGGLLFGSLAKALQDAPDVAFVQPILDELSRCSGTWKFAGILHSASRFPLEVSASDLRAAYTESEPDNDLYLIYGRLLSRLGLDDEARPVVRSLLHESFNSHRDDHRFGLTNIGFAVELRRLQCAMGLAEGALPPGATAPDAANAHVATTARLIGALFAQGAAGGLPDARATFRSLLLFHNQAPAVSHHDGYVVRMSRNEIEGQIRDLAQALGHRAIEALRDVYLELSSGPAADQFSSVSRRRFALMFFAYGVMSRPDAIALGMSSLDGVSDSDPALRREACMEAAAFLHAFGEDDEVERWIRRASDVSAGTGSHKDYHMADVATWVMRSTVGGALHERLALLNRLASAIEVAGGAGEDRAATTLLETLFRESPLRASVMALELIDRRVLDIPQMLNAVVIGAAKAGGSAELLAHVYGQLCALLNVSQTPDTAGVVLAQFEATRRSAAAEALMSRVRTMLSLRLVGISRDP
jgi:hypothetical protein